MTFPHTLCVSHIAPHTVNSESGELTGRVEGLIVYEEGLSVCEMIVMLLHLPVLIIEKQTPPAVDMKVLSIWSFCRVGNHQNSTEPLFDEAPTAKCGKFSFLVWLKGQLVHSLAKWRGMYQEESCEDTAAHKNLDF